MAQVAKRALKDRKVKEHKSKNLSQSVLRKIRASHEKQKRLNIIKSITQVRDSWVNEVLMEALDDTSEVIRDFIIDELGKREQIDTSLINRKLSCPPWYVKSSVLRILG